MRIDVVDVNLKHNTFLSQLIEKQTQTKIHQIFQGRSYWINSDLEKNIKESLDDLFRDPIDQTILGNELSFTTIDFDYLIEISFRPGVTDNRAQAAKEAILDKLALTNLKVATGDFFLIKTAISQNELVQIAEQSLGNPLIQRIKVYSKHDILNTIPSPEFPEVKISPQPVTDINLDLNIQELVSLSEQKLWALNRDELQQIKDYFSRPDNQITRKQKRLPQNPTDIEMEIIAQTWSEHCKHKIFNAQISYREAAGIQNPIGPQEITSLFKDYIFKATFDVQKKFNIDWLVSVFKDNAGIVRFDDQIDFCFKVETHNSPSALDPYGGALTGILGVNRDILGCGLGAMPIANTNVLCFANPDLKEEVLKKLPKKLKHPLSLLKGVHKGIEDGGNKSGIPTVNGAIHFHDNYAGKPLVYCGTVGVTPQKINHIPTSEKRHQPGDYIVVCGGSVGADGIHGATFSSLELDDDAPATAVQIGDPFTQKRLSDFLLEARDQMLFSGITDNGAGGLSSSVGEMAEHTGGATIELEQIPRKYPGLSPWEVIISESQERMTFAVPPEKLSIFMELAAKRQVNPAIIGHFTNTNFFEITQNGKLVASLNLDFLHNSLIPMQLDAYFEGAQPNELWHKISSAEKVTTIEDKVYTLLKNPNISSKESLVRQFDHEVKGSTVVKPFISNKFTSPSDAAVIMTALFGGSEMSAIAISNGIAPQYSHLDTYYMTQFAIDEAVRNAVASGANPEFICLCDNFCWPDPIESQKTPDGKHKLAQLVRSAQALYDTAMVYGTPFVSGKDSMKNDFLGKDPDGKTIKISIPPTLLISALAKLDNVEDFMTSEFKQSGDSVFYIGPEFFRETYYSTIHPRQTELAPIDLNFNKQTFSIIHELIRKKLIQSCHDVSEGGILISTIESCFAENLGVHFDHTFLKPDESMEAYLFNELSGGFIISTNNEKEFLKLAANRARKIGVITQSPYISFEKYFHFPTNELFEIWSKNDY